MKIHLGRRRTLLAIAALLLGALVGGVVLLHRPSAQASPGPTITVNSTADTNERDSVLTLREAMMLATGDLTLGDPDNFPPWTGLTGSECMQVEGAIWVAVECEMQFPLQNPPPGPSNADTIVFDTDVFPPNSPQTITLSSALPKLSTGNDTVDASSAGVIVDGGGMYCFVITSDGNTIKGLEIYNCGWGVYVHSGAQSNTIGGSSPGEGNVISGAELGVVISGAGTNGNVVKGNYIGIDASGTAALPNEGGVSIFVGAQNNIVGGSSAGERNVISGNLVEGAYVGGLGTRGNVIKGNYIGTDASGTAALPNGWGVHISQGPQNNIVGGSSPGEQNVIAFNTTAGVWVVGAGTTGNSITRNSIHANGGKGIETETGGNNELAPPIVDSATGSASGHTSPKCYPCTVEVFSDDEDEGRIYHGSTSTSSDGTWTYSGEVTGPHVTATITDADGNTSEFSAPVLTDSDEDGFSNAIELYLGTDPLDACRDDPADDAWPLDVNNDGQVSVVGDVLNFRGRIGATPGSPDWWQRLDFNADGQLSVVGDVLMYRGRIGETCTN